MLQKKIFDTLYGIPEGVDYQFAFTFAKFSIYVTENTSVLYRVILASALHVLLSSYPKIHSVHKKMLKESQSIFCFGIPSFYSEDCALRASSAEGLCTEWLFKNPFGGQADVYP